MADVKQRVTGFPATTEVASDDYLLVDGATKGTRKMLLTAYTDTTLTDPNKAANAKKTGDEITALKEDLSELEGNDVKQKLLNDNIPGTTQSYIFADGSVSKVEHKSGNTVIRTDAFTYTDSVITETRTLNTGDKLVIATNLSTLETTVTYTAA